MQALDTAEQVETKPALIMHLRTEDGAVHRLVDAEITPDTPIREIRRGGTVTVMTTSGQCMTGVLLFSRVGPN